MCLLKKYTYDDLKYVLKVTQSAAYVDPSPSPDKLFGLKVVINNLKNLKHPADIKARLVSELSNTLNYGGSNAIAIILLNDTNLHDESVLVNAFQKTISTHTYDLLKHLLNIPGFVDTLLSTKLLQHKLQAYIIRSVVIDPKKYNLYCKYKQLNDMLPTKEQIKKLWLEGKKKQN